MEKLGQGGGGQVYLARDLQTGKQRAVKQLFGESREEIHMLRSLEHPMLPQMIDYVQEREWSYLVLEYIPGKNLQELLRTKGGFSRRQVLDWGIQICRVMEYLHSRKPPVIYGDLKPENLMLSNQGKLYLIDLGSAVKGYSARRRSCCGTKGYAAPEQYWGELVPGSDLYAFGKTMEALCGGRLRGSLGWAAGRCCAKEIRDRPESFGTVRRRLEGVRCLTGVSPVLLGAVVGLLLVGILVKTGGKERVVERRVEVPVTKTVVVTVLPSKIPDAKPTTSEAPDGEEKKITERPAPSESSGEKEGFLEELTTLQASLLAGFAKPQGEKEARLLQESERKLCGMEEDYPQKEAWCRIRLLRIQIADARQQWLVEKQLYEELLARFPDCREAYGSYGSFLCRSGEQEESVNLWKESEEVFGFLDAYGEQRWKEELELYEEMEE